MCGKMIQKIEGTEAPGQEILKEYTNPSTERYEKMNEEIRKKLNFTSLKYLHLEDLISSVGIKPCNLCTYCWDGKE